MVKGQIRMGIDWEAIAGCVGGLGEDGNERIVGTPGGRRAIEILLREQNLRDAVDYWLLRKPGCFTAEMVLKIIRSKVAMERCYEIYKTESDRMRACSAVFLLAAFANDEVLPWILEFLDDSQPAIRWNGLHVLRYVLYDPVSDTSVTTAVKLLNKADSDSDIKIRNLAAEVRRQLARHERT